MWCPDLPGALAAIRQRLPRHQGRARRRCWVGEGRAHIEVRGVGRVDTERFARRVETELERLGGVHWARVNAVTGRVVVAFADGELDADDLVELIEGVEEAHELDAERFPRDRPEHPGDIEPQRRQLIALCADAVGIGLGATGRLLRVPPLSAELASLLTLVDATPALRRPLEDRLGHPATDLGLAVANAVAQGLAQGPLGLVVDAAHRGLLVREVAARRAAWARREPELHAHTADPVPPLPPVERPTPLPAGPIERYADRAGAAALAGALGAAAVTRRPRTAVTALLTATPKAARLGREAFAAEFGRRLAGRGVLPLDPQVLRRLDRVDTVVLDAEVLRTDRQVISAVWVPPDQDADQERAWLAVRRLLDPSDAVALRGEGRWRLAPVAALGVPLPPAARRAVRDLRRPGATVLGLAEGAQLAALAVTEPELDPLTDALVASARAVGELVVAGAGSGVGQRLHADRIVPGGNRLAEAVRTLQSEGRVVVLVSARQSAALRAADIGVGVAGPRLPAPWGAHLMTASGLADACQILQAVPPARATSRRGVLLAGYGTGAGALLALAGPRFGATSRAALAVNGAALVALGAGAWSAVQLGRRSAPQPADTTDWHALPADRALDRLRSSPAGLDAEEAHQRLTAQPAVAVPSAPGVVSATLEELANPLTPALASGAGLSAASGSVTDATLISAVMAVNAVLGGVQRVGADRALRRLLSESAVRVRLRRGGTEALTTADRLVPGDVIVLHAGDAVPADCRILEATGVEVDESSLTGESQPVVKTAEPTAAASVADRRSMLYAGTALAAGGATALVVATGSATQIGRSAQAAEAERRPGGVQARLRQLTAVSVPVALGAGAALVGAGLTRGRPLSATLGTGVSLAVAAVPEGLPLVATVAQLAAARRLSHRNALVRASSTIEALGRVDVLCADKTGTLTTGVIELRSVWAGGKDQPIGSLDAAGRLVLAAGLRASPAHANGEHVAHPTDRAVVAGAGQAEVTGDYGVGQWAMVDERPFEPSRGYSAVLGRTPTGHLLAVKGAPEVVLPGCTAWLRPDGVARFQPRDRVRVEAAVEQLARQGNRLLAIAERHASGPADLGEDAVRGLRFVGLLALGDPVRDTAAAAVRGLRAAGVDIRMVTGDHPSTAESIAAELDLLDGRRVLTGTELDGLADADLDRVLPDVSVFARVTPAHKVRIVQALRHSGRVVAMTGDGANDAPAIRLADVGVALGGRGTNAAKEAADVVVTDDRLETIIDAITEGRAMWASVRDAIALLLGGNLGEIAFTLGSGVLLPGGSPLNARQLLLVNLLTDMLPSMALAVRAPASRSPQALLHEGPDASLGASLLRDVLIRGGLTAAAAGGGWLVGRATGTRGHAGTVALVALVGAQLGQTIIAGRRSPLVVGASVASGAALAGIVQTPGLSQFFGCRPLGPLGWSAALGAATVASVGAPVTAAVVDRLLPPAASTPARGRADGPPVGSDRRR